VLIPVFGPNDEVILPPSALQWLCRQPDNVVSSHAAQNDAIQLEHSLGPKFAYDPWGGILIKTDLNSALETVCAVMNDELSAAFEDCFGNDVDNWKEIDLFPACRAIGGRATLRFTLGDSPEGRRLCKSYSEVMNCSPTRLRANRPRPRPRRGLHCELLRRPRWHARHGRCHG
jgi:hypothetical protein